MQQEAEFINSSIPRGEPDVPMELQQMVQETEIRYVKGYVLIQEHKRRAHLLQNCPLHRRDQATLKIR